MSNIPYNYLLVPPPPGGFNAPPMVPNINAPQQISYLVPHIAATIANSAARTATNHPGRVYAYNMLSMNGFNNNDFAQVVATAADLLFLGLNKNMYRGPEDGIVDACDRALSIFISFSILSNQEVMQRLQPDIVNDARTNASVFQQLQQEINAMKSGGFQQPMQNQYNNPQYPQQNFGGGSQYNPQQNCNNAYQQPQNQPSIQRSYSNTPTGSIFTANQNTMGQPSNDQRSNMRSFGAPHVHQRQVQEPVVNTPVAITPTDDTLIWSPSDKQFYPITISPKTQKHGVKVIQENGQAIKISYPIQLKDNEMDRALHTIEHFGKEYTTVLPMAYNTRTEAIREGTRNFTRVTGSDILAAREDSVNTNTEKDAELTVKLQEINSIVSSKWIQDTTISGLMTTSKVNQIKSNGGEPGTVFTMYGIIGEPVVLVPNLDYGMIFTVLSKTSRHIDVVGLIDGLLTKLGKNTSDIYLATRINDYMTDVINRVIENNLSIPELHISSYKDDIADLAGHLEKHYSLLHREAFENMEAKLLKKVFSNYEGGGDLSLRDNLIDEEDSDVVDVEFLVSNYSFTHLAFHSTELNISPYEKCASLVDASTAILYHICTAMLKQEKESNTVIYRRFIITADDVAYEISDGWLSKNAITVSNVKIK